ncbi:MAG TPA: universal stress protein [Nitrospirota bacterium]
MYRKILIATDGSPSGSLAVTHGIGLAKLHGASVDAVYVITPLGEGIDFYRTDELDKALSREAEGVMAAVMEEGGKNGVETKPHVLAGEPEDEIVKFADTNGTDLIVMGSHGHKGFVKLLIGSVAERVIGHAHCPVLVLKHR